MWPFGNRLDDEQKSELREAATELNARRDGLQTAFGVLARRVGDLHQKCSVAASVATEPVVSNNEILEAVARLDEFKSELHLTEEAFAAVTPRDWYPKKFRQAYQDSRKGLHSVKQMLGTVEEALQPPALKIEPGRHKPNMFSSGLNVLATLINHGPRFKSG